MQEFPLAKSLATSFILGLTVATLTPIIYRNRIACSFVSGAIFGVLAFIFYLYYLLDLPIHRYDASAQKLVCTTAPYPIITGPAFD